jgi:hypothetical protein
MKGTGSMLVATLLFPALAVAQMQVPHIITDTQNVNVVTGASGCVTSCPSHNELNEIARLNLRPLLL